MTPHRANIAAELVLLDPPLALLQLNMSEFSETLTLIGIWYHLKAI